MSGLDLRALLREAAEAATPGPWTDLVPRMIHRKGVAGYIGTIDHTEDQAFVASANPTAVIEMLDRIDALSATLDRVRVLHSDTYVSVAYPGGRELRTERCAACSLPTPCPTTAALSAVTAALRGES